MMVSSAQLKFIKSLQQKKFRDLHNVFVVEGEKIVSELPTSMMQVEVIFASEPWVEKYHSIFDSSTTINKASSKDMERISGQKTPSSVLAIVKKPIPDLAFEACPDETIIALDTIQDPGNLGTIIRTADWFGIKNIVCSYETADLFNPKVIQATMGSFARVRVLYVNLAEFLKKQKKTRQILGATLKGAEINKFEPGTGSILVIGNESKGISKNILPILTKEVKIPGGTKPQGAESLNAAVAAGVLMAWVSKSL